MISVILENIKIYKSDHRDFQSCYNTRLGQWIRSFWISRFSTWKSALLSLIAIGHKHDWYQTFWTPKCYSQNNWKDPRYGVGRSKFESARGRGSHWSSHSSVVSNLNNDHLAMRKLSARWAPRLLTNERKSNRNPDEICAVS